MGEIAGVNTASVVGCLHSSRTRARWAEGFHDELDGHMIDVERDRPLQVVPFPVSQHDMTTNNQTIPDRSPSELTRTVPSAVHQDGSVKHATCAPSKIFGRDNITIGTWNTRTIRAVRETPGANT